MVTKEKAERIAEELDAQVQEALSYFGTYETKIHTNDIASCVYVIPKDSDFITCAALENVIKLYESLPWEYKDSIFYGIGIYTCYDKSNRHITLPCVKILVEIKEKKP